MNSRSQTKIEQFFEVEAKKEVELVGEEETKKNQVVAVEEEEEDLFGDEDFPVDDLFNSFSSGQS
jgi:hypothetical protein